MFDYTKAIFRKTKNDLETALRAFQLGTQILYIAYLIFALLVPNNIWYLHLILLVVSAIFLAFDIFTHRNLTRVKKERGSFFNKKAHKSKLRELKKQHSNIRKWKFYISHFLKAFVLAAAFYPIIVSPYSVHPLSIISTTVMAFMWIMQIVFEILRLILEDRGAMFIEAMKADVEFITKPVNTVKNTIKRFMGKDVEEESAPTEERVYLDQLLRKGKTTSEESNGSKSEHGENIADWLDARISKFRRKVGTKTNVSVENDDNNDF